MRDRSFRLNILRSHGASAAEAAELLAYNDSAFGHVPFAELRALPLPDEPFVGAWQRYVAAAAREGAFPCLRRRLVQLRFPIARGISESADYRSATRRGAAADASAAGLRLRSPDALRVRIHPTAAGRIPVIIAAEREDFVSLVQALTRRNEPDPIPASIGALMVAGYNNWDRIAALRRRWERRRGRAGSTWDAAFRQIIPRRELYQDRFILLSAGPYSGTPAGDVGLSPPDWERLSIVIRLEHECAHYFTRRVFGSMRNALLDELIADYAGIVAAIGRYRADWFLRFVGLEPLSRYREGGRLQNYRGAPPLSDGAFAVLQLLVRGAAQHLEAFDAGRSVVRSPGARAIDDRTLMIAALTRLTLEELASDAATSFLAEAVSDVERALRPRPIRGGALRTA
jgi:hypothetical protein